MDLDDLAARLEDAADRVAPTIARNVRREAEHLRDDIRSNASGRPGPNVITGDYRSSWRVAPFAVSGGGGATVGTDRPQGRRLEFGFWDMTDSLGRHYFQPPYPHVEPAVSALGPRIQAALRTAAGEILRGDA
ncbi:HK97 gp10 family phage protein [Streptomyces sp. NPDC059740]|uniref:HK97 gp10 family phage protein n=1 Tax=Streptomyces sp. NPDC059740 TaxID=3346926 RepID=UPI003652D17B